MSFKFDASNMLNGLVDTDLKMKASIGLYADTVAKKFEGHAKQQAIWQDRTGLARGTLSGTWKWVGPIARIQLSHGMKYGVYLEFANERRYAIIKPTIDLLSPQAIKGLNKILK